MSVVNISGLDKAELLAVLYNRANPQGMGFLHYVPGDMPIEEARKLVEAVDYFDYVKGRVMKVDISRDEMSTFLYNRDNGEGAAEAVVAKLRESKSQ